MTQAKAAKLLDTHQTQISRLNSGEGINGISIEILMTWLTKLDRGVALTKKQNDSNDKPIGKITIIKDFLPPPFELIRKL